MSNILLPATERQPTHLFFQESLIEEQLPKYLQRLIDAEADIQSVFRTSGFGMGFRFCVAYIHHEELSSEIFC